MSDPLTTLFNPFPSSEDSLKFRFDNLTKKFSRDIDHPLIAKAKISRKDIDRFLNKIESITGSVSWCKSNPGWIRAGSVAVYSLLFLPVFYFLLHPLVDSIESTLVISIFSMIIYLVGMVIMDLCTLHYYMYWVSTKILEAHEFNEVNNSDLKTQGFKFNIPANFYLWRELTELEDQAKQEKSYAWKIFKCSLAFMTVTLGVAIDHMDFKVPGDHVQQLIWTPYLFSCLWIAFWCLERNIGKVVEDAKLVAAKYNEGSLKTPNHYEWVELQMDEKQMGEKEGEKKAKEHSGRQFETEQDLNQNLKAKTFGQEGERTERTAMI